MMKQIYIALASLAIGYFVGAYSWPDDPDTSAIDDKIEKIIYERDSLQKYIAAKDDTLLSVMNEMWQAKNKVEELKDKLKKLRYDTPVFHPLPNDAARDIALAKLYPSFHPVRQFGF